jgi:FkbM family methyltransferase
LHLARAREIANRSDADLAADLDVPAGPPTKALIKSLTTKIDNFPLDRKVRIAAFLARHGFTITFDDRFAKYCNGGRYSQQIHATNVELHLLQDRLGLITAAAATPNLPSDVAAFHAALLGQNPLIQDVIAPTLERAVERSFIHVGANDLRDADDETHAWIIQSQDWACILVEPQPRVFERLRKTVQGAPNVTLINAAIAAHDGTAELTIFRLDVWSSMAPRTIAIRESFNEPKQVVEVPCMTVGTLLRTHGIGALGFLVIDTEGLDKVILDQFLDITRPGMILCEVAHLPGNERTSVLARLDKEGYEYRLVKGDRDVLAIRPDWLV